MQILDWLKQPDVHFAETNRMPADCDFEGGVCVGSIANKAGMAQSVISGYLVKLQKAGLLESKRHCQWTYYRRDEEGIRKFIDRLGDRL